MGDSGKKRPVRRVPPEGRPIEPQVLEGTGDDAADFIRIEKQIVGVGFFTPTSKELKTTRVKTVTIKRENEEGRAVETRIRIVTGGDYGLPGTADLDKWLALQKILNNHLRKFGEVTNPIKFSSWELLSTLGFHRKSGRNYEIISEFLDRMVATTIEVSGDGIIDGQRRLAKDRIKLFERAVSFGRELEPGRIADSNYIWLSEFLLESINTHNLLPIDLETYRALKNPIAKTLVPLLQIWLHASQSGSVFTKRYDAVCQLLGIKEWTHESKIKEKLGPSLNELERHGYIAAWGIEKLRGTSGYKLILRHGAKFFRDQAENQRRQGLLTSGASEGESSENLVEMLVKRGVLRTVAQQLVNSRVEGQFIEDQVEWFDEMLARRGAEKYKNPPGLLVTIIKLNMPIDPNFVTSRMRRLREEYEARRRTLEAASEIDDEAAPFDLDEELPPRQLTPHELLLLEDRYREYKRSEVLNYINGLPPDEYDALMKKARKQFETEFAAAAKAFNKQNAESVIMGLAEKIAAPDVAVISLEEFIERQGKDAISS